MYGTLGPTASSARTRRTRRIRRTRPARRRPIIWSAPTATPTACRSLITNCSNNYGPYQFPEKLIPLMILNALEGRPLPIYGDGGQRPRLAARRGSLRRPAARARKRAAGREVQHRRRQRADQSRARRSPVRRARRAAARRVESGARRRVELSRAQDASCPIGPATIAATRSTPRRFGSELGWRPRHDLRERSARDGAVVPRSPRLVRARAGRPLRS